jgi:hypothetical protein
LALLSDALRKFAGSGGTLVLARVVSTGFRLGELSSSERGVAARLNMPRTIPNEQRAKPSKTRGLKMPDLEAELFRMAVFRLFLRKRSQRLLANNGNIGRIDTAADVNIFSEVRGSNRLKCLLPHRRHIGRVHPTARIYIAD